MIEYELMRSKRKTLAIQVKPDSSVIVRAPLDLADSTIVQFVEEHEDWVIKKQKEIEENQKLIHVITAEERREGFAKARKIIPERARYFALQMGVDYKYLKIKEQKSRWGSCSSIGNLNFNWKLVLLPPELLDYVVVHELAHRKVMNHAPLFWFYVEQEIPDYRERREKLKMYGMRLG